MPVDFPRELIYDGVIFHLRQEWAAQPAVLRNVGLQLALTCTWLYRELQGDLEERQRAILSKAMDMRIPGSDQPDYSAQRLLGLYGDVGRGLARLSSSDLSGCKTLKIRSLDLNLPVLRSSDTDLIWSIRNIVLKQAETTLSLNSFRLSLTELPSAVESDRERRSRWARSLFGMLDVVRSLHRVVLHVTFIPAQEEEPPKAFIQATPPADGDEEFRHLSPLETMDDQQAKQSAPLASLLSQLRNLLSPTHDPRRRNGDADGLTSLVLQGPLYHPLFLPFGLHAARRPPTFCLNIHRCLAPSHLWNASLQAWSLPRITRLTLKGTNTPLSVIINFLQRHPTLEALSVTQSHSSSNYGAQQSDVTDAAAIRLNIKRLGGEPDFLKALFQLNVELPRLAVLTIDSEYDPDIDIAQPGPWTDLTFLLALLGGKQTSLTISAPLSLTLQLPRSQGMDQWLATIDPPHEDEVRPWWNLSAPSLSSTASRVVQGHQRVPPLGDGAAVTALTQCIQNLQCVTSLELLAHKSIDDGRGSALTDPNHIIALIAAFPSLKKAHISTMFTDVESPGGGGCDETPQELWQDLGGVWSASRTLQVLEVFGNRKRDGTAYDKWVWKRGNPRPPAP